MIRSQYASSRKKALLCIFALLFGALFLSSPALAFNPPQASDMPASINLRGHDVQLSNLENPLRRQPEMLAQNLTDGRNLYFKHCYLCHGDLLDGKGLFSDRFNPPPANFRDAQNGLSGKSEAYAFWRIAKGGRGLPDRFEPWNSAMPAWEKTLNENDIWQIVLFLRETINKDDKTSPGVSPSVERGAMVFGDKCAVCHGETGDGKGVTEATSRPKPRNFTKGQFKLRTTPFGTILTDDDILQTITKGIPGTTMPGWAHLPEVDRTSLVLFIKTLSKNFEKRPKPITIPDPPESLSLKSIQNGKKLFLRNCSGCHGAQGRSDGASVKRVANLPSNALYPRNLSKPWYFRRGGTRKELFITIRTGLSATAMPRFAENILSDSELWDVVHFVQTLSLSERPCPPEEIKAARLKGALPSKADDPAWKSVDAYMIPLGGQIADGEKLFYPMVDAVWLKAVYNDKEIAFQLTWDDPTPDFGAGKGMRIETSPAPPLPPELQEMADVEAERNPVEPEEFPDRLALQFPLNPNAGMPYFLDGDADHPVYKLEWRSNPFGAGESIARGLSNEASGQAKTGKVQTHARYRQGQYQIMIKRDRRSSTDSTQFESGKSIPIALQAQDGKEKETGTKKSLSSWYRLTLE